MVLPCGRRAERVALALRPIFLRLIKNPCDLFSLDLSSFTAALQSNGIKARFDNIMKHSYLHTFAARKAGPASGWQLLHFDHLLASYKKNREEGDWL
jgi:hypothetical protein